MLERAVAALTGDGAAYLEAQALAALAQALAACGDTAAADQAWQRVDHLYSAADLPEQDRFNHPRAVTHGTSATDGGGQ